MFKSLKSKLIIPSVGVLILLVSIIIVYATVSMNNFANDLSAQRLETAMLTTDSYLSSLQEQSRLASIAAAGTSEVVEHVRNWNAGINPDENRQALLRHLSSIMPGLDIETIVIVDQNQVVMLRTHAPDTYGDSVYGVPLFMRGAAGEYIPSFSSTAAIPLTMSFMAPIYDDGVIIGTLSTNVVMSSNEFVDNFGRALNAEITVFAGSERVATTLLDESGQREVGIQAPEGVIQVVIEENRHYYGEIYLQGLPFSVYYFPLHGWDGSVVGMFFAGFSNEDTYAATGALQTTLLIFGLVGLVVACAIMYVISSRLISPINNLVTLVSDVSSGKLNVNVDKQKLPKDEIGSLTLDIVSLVDVIKNIVDDLSNIQQEYNIKGNMSHRVNAEKYENSFKEVVVSVNGILDEEVANIQNTSDLLKSIGEGKFDVKISELPGDFVMQTDSMRSVVAKLSAVEREINSIVDAAANKGDLDYKIDVTQFEGSWQEIMKGLNDICKAVNDPISEIKAAIDRINQGFFDARINGDYAGVFLAMKEAVNFFITDTDDYMQEINKCVGALAEGDLNSKINLEFIGDYAPVKQAINNISSTLHKTMSEINAASQQVLAGARQISTSATDLANGAQTQASSVEELNASIDLITQQTRQNADDASNANELSSKSTSNAREGNESMRQMLSAMDQIKESSQGISKIIKTIQDIAFQTNLLSLNAAVEAARAGEHGKGFSVVAEEVRNLAGRSQQATVESTNLIQESMERVDSGSEIATSTSESLDTIVSGAGEISEIIDRISSSSKEQAEAISQVSSGISQISQVVQSNSAVSEETAAAAEELNSQAELLQQLVSYFKL